MLKEKNVKVAGIHLAGPNSNKTTLVIMTGRWGEGNLKIEAIFDHLGPLQRLFSDERLFDLLKKSKPDRAVIDCPLTVPPCVACVRPSCPGVDPCEDIAVAYMQKLVTTASGRKRRRPLNPQTQRIWDVQSWFDGQSMQHEPTYSANRAPIVVRAITLQRRLRSLDPGLSLIETSVPHVLEALSQQLGIDPALALEYRAFEIGRQRRKAWLEILHKLGFLQFHNQDEQLELFAQSFEAFSALISGIVASLSLAGLCPPPSNDFYATQGWVYLPELACQWPRPS